jgi:hypothetical protein
MTLVASLAVLSACGGGGGSSSSTPTPTPNTLPVANAGTNQSVGAGALVTLNGSASSDPDGSVASYTWSQTAGPAVTLSSTTAAQPTFTAPSPAAATTLTFQLRVTDNRGGTSGPATVNITVSPLPAGSVTGRISFVRIPFGSGVNDGLDYAAPVNSPARGVTVRALAAGTNMEITRTVTNGNGDYAMNVTPGANVTVQVVAEMLRAAPTALPHWNFTVRDLPPLPDPTDPNPPAFPPDPLPAIHAYTDGVQFTAGSAPHDLLIPSGFNAAGNVTGPRASAPFAILDTIYEAVELVVGANSTVDFPDLVVDWGTSNVPEDGTYFTSSGLQHMVLTADVTADTDEFDQHVIAHEFGHYIEYNFSRADNIGGAHGIGDKLDARVAFGEGFGYAFGAIVLNQPVTRDSFVDDSFGCPNDQCSSTFNVQSNPPASGGVNGNFGCWCSESSVWAILWDVFDNDAEAGDTVALGFTPIWNVLVGTQRTTPAFTTIFSFITALKLQSPGSAAAIDTLVTAQNINSATMDAYGSTETNVPTPFTNIEALPIYSSAIIGAPTTLRTTNRGGPTNVDSSGNKLGNHRYIRFTSPSTTVTINATSTSPLATRDVDFLVYRASPFALYRTAISGPAASEVLSNMPIAPNAEYLIDVYDCANGCDPAEGTPGNYDLTVTVSSP